MKTYKNIYFDICSFRNLFLAYKKARKRNVRKIIFKIEQYKVGNISRKKLMESFQGWNAYAKWANSYNLRKHIFMEIIFIHPL